MRYSHREGIYSVFVDPTLAILGIRRQARPRSEEREEWRDRPTENERAYLYLDGLCR